MTVKRIGPGASRASGDHGVDAIRRAVPALRPDHSKAGTRTWWIRTQIPLLADGRLALRFDQRPRGKAAALLDGFAEGDDPGDILADLKAAVASQERDSRQALDATLGRLRQQVEDDLRELGGDAASYVEMLDQWLRSRQFSDGPNLSRSVSEALKSGRARAKIRVRQGSQLRRLRDQVGFGTYVEKFDVARRLDRRIVFHVGPTNSGKTFAALEILSKAETGAYLAPLRLLALENFEGLLARGLRAGMVTGEEVLGEPDPTHTSRTIETADLTRPVDVAVIDEIQMLSDPDRGWAWTNALFGVPAKLVVVCGSEDALSAVRRAARAAGESLDVVEFERKTPLLLVPKPVPIERVEAGDAVVAFSRRAVHEFREILVRRGHGVATIYGALSPEVRRTEAARFRSGEADVLVTTDAIGMGLNLGPLKRILFSTTRKWDGTAERALTNSEIRQIAGRAGRFGHQEAGYVAALEDEDLDPIRLALGGAPTPPPYDARFFVRPDLVAITSASREIGTESLREVLAHFARATFYEGSPFQASALDEIQDVANRIDRVRLPIEEKFAFSVCPVDRRDSVSMDVLLRWAEAHAAGVSVPALRVNFGGELDYQERAVKLSSAYLWLARRFPATFDDVDAVREMRSRANAAIERHLRDTAIRKAEHRSRGRGRAR